MVDGTRLKGGPQQTAGRQKMRILTLYFLYRAPQAASRDEAQLEHEQSSSLVLCLMNAAHSSGLHSGVVRNYWMREAYFADEACLASRAKPA